MVNNSAVKLEDGNDYIVVDKIDNYVFLSNLKDSNDFCIRKEIEENDTTYLVGLDNNEEYEKIVKLLLEKNNNQA